MFSHNFSQDLEILLSQIGKEPFAFTRFADGEHAVLEGQPINGYDWTMESSFSLARKDINSSLEYRDPRYFYGISCACCDSIKSQYYKNRLTNCLERVSYSNMFVNSNYNKAREWLSAIPSDSWLLCNEKAKNKSFPFKSNNIYFNSNIVKAYESEKNTILSSVNPILEESNKIVLVSVGPLSEILIYHLWNHNKTNYYIDIGSIIDPYIHGNTRIYHHDSSWLNRTCTSLYV